VTVSSVRVPTEVNGREIGSPTFGKALMDLESGDN